MCAGKGRYSKKAQNKGHVYLDLGQSEDNLENLYEMFHDFHSSPNIITRQEMYVFRRVRATIVAVEKQ